MLIAAALASASVLSALAPASCAARLARRGAARRRGRARSPRSCRSRARACRVPRLPGRAVAALVGSAASAGSPTCASAPTDHGCGPSRIAATASAPTLSYDAKGRLSGLGEPRIVELVGPDGERLSGTSATRRAWSEDGSSLEVGFERENRILAYALAPAFGGPARPLPTPRGLRALQARTVASRRWRCSTTGDGSWSARRAAGPPLDTPAWIGSGDALDGAQLSAALRGRLGRRAIPADLGGPPARRGRARARAALPADRGSRAADPARRSRRCGRGRLTAPPAPARDRPFRAASDARQLRGDRP